MSPLTSLRKSLLAVAAVALVVAGCSNGASATAKPVPTPSVGANELVAQSVSKLTGIKTVHGKIEVSGSLQGDLAKQMNLPAGSSMKLTGTTLDMDVDATDQSNPKAHVTLSAPSIFGLTADIIVVDGYTYYKTSMTGDKYTKQKNSDATDSAPVPVSPTDIEAQMKDFQKSLDDLGTGKYVGTDKVDGKDAYHVQLAIPKEKLSDASSSMGMSVTSASVDVWIYAADSRPAKLEFKADAGTSGNVDVVMTLTKYNQAVPAIKAPAADEITAGS